MHCFPIKSESLSILDEKYPVFTHEIVQTKESHPTFRWILVTITSVCVDSGQLWEVIFPQYNVSGSETQHIETEWSTVCYERSCLDASSLYEAAASEMDCFVMFLTWLQPNRTNLMKFYTLDFCSERVVCFMLFWDSFIMKRDLFRFLNRLSHSRVEKSQRRGPRENCRRENRTFLNAQTHAAVVSNKKVDNDQKCSFSFSQKPTQQGCLSASGGKVVSALASSVASGREFPCHNAVLPEEHSAEWKESTTMLSPSHETGIQKLFSFQKRCAFAVWFNGILIDINCPLAHTGATLQCFSAPHLSPFNATSFLRQCNLITQCFFCMHNVHSKTAFSIQTRYCTPFLILPRVGPISLLAKKRLPTRRSLRLCPHCTNANLGLCRNSERVEGFLDVTPEESFTFCLFSNSVCSVSHYFQRLSKICHLSAASCSPRVDLWINLCE